MPGLHECSLYKKQEELIKEINENKEKTELQKNAEISNIKKYEICQCLACSHKCLIQNENTGICGVRGNKNGLLYLLVYGKIIAEHIDPIEKKPIYHFLHGTSTYSIGTVGCNFRCGFCQNYDISQARKFLSGKEKTPKEIVDSALQSNCKSISYTYNEPTIFIEFVKDTAILARKAGLKNILVTNGYMTKEALDFLQLNKKESLIDAMNIDLKSYNEEFYKKICGAHLKPVLETIKLAKKRKIHVELTTLIIPGENDNIKEFEKIAEFISKIDKNIPWHISRFFPMYKMMEKHPTEISVLQTAYKIGRKAGLKNIHMGNI